MGYIPPPHLPALPPSEKIEVFLVAQVGDTVQYRHTPATRVRYYSGIIERISVEFLAGQVEPRITYHINAGTRDAYSTTDRKHKVPAYDITAIRRKSAES